MDSRLEGGRVLSDPALVSDQAASRLAPPGFDPSRYVLHTIAAIIDHPSLYMGGPSRGALKKAAEILRFVTTDAIAMETRQGGDSEAAPSQGDDSAGPEGIAQPSSALTDEEGGS